MKFVNPSEFSDVNLHKYDLRTSSDLHTSLISRQRGRGKTNEAEISYVRLFIEENDQICEWRKYENLSD